MKEYTLDRLISIAAALTAERDIGALLELILTEAMDITSCDGGTVYKKEGDLLYFYNMITRSKGIKSRATRGEISLPPVPLGRTHVCACSALDQKKINIPDIYQSKEYDFAGAKKYDELNGYRTKSMLVLPMEDDHGDVIGVLQLINAADEEGNIIPFSKDFERLIFALSSLAAVSLNNSQLSQEVSDILHSFVKVMVGAIDTRSKYNANHTKSMVKYAERFIGWLDDTGRAQLFSEKTRDPFLMSIWLHDIGKLVISHRIMDKPSRLGWREKDLMHRIEIGLLMERIRRAEKPEEREDAEKNIAELENVRALIVKANNAGFLEDDIIASLRSAADIECMASDGTRQALLNEDELDAITVKKGTLTQTERHKMEEHVEYTAELLSKMKFRGVYSDVPVWAALHHELLDGSGYPDHKKGDELPLEVRLLTILDIYDALTAEDRPYKPPMEPEKAFKILGEMAEQGKIDGELLALFKESGAYKKA